jgi:hypothetical protein
MAYKTDGSSHLNGIKLEKLTIQILIDSYSKKIDILDLNDEIPNLFDNISSINFSHKGGTGQKADALSVVTMKSGKRIQKLITIKKKKFEKGKPKGTFDIINTTLSKFNATYKVFDDQVIDELNLWLFYQRNKITKKEDIDMIRQDYLNICSDILDKIEDNTTKFIELIKKEFYKTDYIIIARSEESSNDADVLTGLYVGLEKKIDLFGEFKAKNTIFYTEKGRGDSSRQIWRKDENGKKSKTPFRIRLVLNNGLSAAFGLSDANDTSEWTIKIQVDDVLYITNQLKFYELNNKF